MAQMQLPLPPKTPHGGDLQRWASALTAYLRAEAQQGLAMPKPVLLASWTPEATAVQDGVLMFDRVSQSAVISTDGQWLPIFSGEAYGGMRSGAAPVSVPDLTTAWRAMANFAENMLPSVGMVFDLVTGKITFLTTGVFNVNFYDSFQHNNAGQAREIDVRFRNTLTNNTSRTGTVATGSGDRTTTIAYSFLANIGPVQVGQPYVIEIAAPIGNYTTVVLYGSAISAARIAYVPL